MKISRTLDQHIAVFGESGSGKTVLLSSFYGATQEPEVLRSNPYRVVADNATDGTLLHQNYLGMRDSAKRPRQTKFASTAHAFSVKIKSEQQSRTKFDALRLIWHDYPGEWFEQDTSSREEAQRRVDTFRSLLASDVAVLLIDGQKLIDNEGEEERYLKSLFGNIRNGLLRLKDDLLDDGQKLVTFPRIWMFALSKADLLPECDVFRFRDLLIHKVGEEISDLRSVIADLVESDEALSVGEDFVLLSSAKFEPDKITVTERIGVDLMLPIAAMLPFERHLRWAQKRQISSKVLEELLEGVVSISASMLTASGWLKKIPKIGKFTERTQQVVNVGARAADALVGDNLQKRHDEAVASHDSTAAALTGLRLQLERGESDRILFKSLI